MQPNRVSAGADGLDTVLCGGLVEGRNTLIRGPPGSGKTIFGLHFLSATKPGETSLYVNLGEPQEYIEDTIKAFDIETDIQFHNLSPTKEQFSESQSYSLFDSSEVEKPRFITELRQAVDAVEADRVLLDPITEFRYLTADERQFRTGILGLLDYFKATETTVMLTSQAGGTVTDDDLQFLSDSVISLDVTTDIRTLNVTKLRGSSFRRGPHFYDITEEGLVVWPKLAPREVEQSAVEGTVSSGLAELDKMLSGGIERGTVTILSGPTGVGKTTIGIQFLAQAAMEGSKGYVFQFEESERTLRQRADAVNIPLEQTIEDGSLRLIEIEPDEFCVGEFEHMVREAVSNGAEAVMIDGTAGFKQNLRGLSQPTETLVRIGRFLRAAGVTTIIVNEVHNITGTFQATEERTSNLADNIIFLRHVEYKGEMRKVIGTLKLRTSDFERTLRELEITEGGIQIGDPLGELRGILTGTPEWSG